MPYHIRVADGFMKQPAEQLVTAATAEKRNRQEALIVLLRKLKHYVEDNCGNDMAVLLSSGFQAASITRTRLPLANPAILGVDSGNSTELVLKVGAIARARCYEVRSEAIGSGNVLHYRCAQNP
jgi:hypothetical protein